MNHKMIKEQVCVRVAAQSDHNFIYSTWKRGLYYGNDWYQSIPADLYFKTYETIINSILIKPSVQVVAACLIEDPDVILGYAVLEQVEKGVRLHWVFTKSAWRKLGIAKMLLPDTIQEVSHLTKMGRNIKPKNWIFNPFVI